jgi:hypothetical protein
MSDCDQHPNVNTLLYDAAALRAALTRALNAYAELERKHELHLQQCDLGTS